MNSRQGVNYTHYADGSVATKTDAKNQRVEYVYDSYKRVTMVKRYPVAGGAEDEYQRTENFYDSNPFDTNFSQNTAGRLAAVRYKRRTASDDSTAPLTFIEMYSYTAAGLPTKKALWLVRRKDSGGNESAAKMVAVYTYNVWGQATSIKYPDTYLADDDGAPGLVSGEQYYYSFDTLGRLNKMGTTSGGGQVVQSVTYGLAGEMLSMLYGNNDTETRTGIACHRTTHTLCDDVLGQMTRLTGRTSGNSLLIDQEYRYSAIQNNGRAFPERRTTHPLCGGQMMDYVAGQTGEEVNYLYDSLNRLVQAHTTDSTWGVQYAYDPFGNKTQHSQVSGKSQYPPFSAVVNASTNRFISISGTTIPYDDNGNQYNPAYQGVASYDIENRLMQWDPSEKYAYAPDNLRVLKRKLTGSPGVYTDQISFYGAQGELLLISETFWQQDDYSVEQIWFTRFNSSTGWLPAYTWFAGKRVNAQSYQGGNNGMVARDRLGSEPGGGTYFPYGETRGAVTSETWGYGTYWRDATGLNYARNRYYSGAYGRFLTPDPYKASASVQNPQSWNRFAYVEGDPGNLNDPEGLISRIPESKEPVLRDHSLQQGPRINSRLNLPVAVACHYWVCGVPVLTIVASRVRTNMACRSFTTPGSPFANSDVIWSRRLRRSIRGFRLLGSGIWLATTLVRSKKRVLVPAASP